MRFVILLSAMALSTPAAAQQHDVQQTTSSSPTSPAVDPKCPPEHAAMGHCTPASATPPQSVADPKCPPEHAAMGHCTPAAATPPQPVVDPKCPPEHAAMGHCVPAGQAGDGTPAPTAPPKRAPPSAAFEGPENAADAIWGADAMAPVRRAVYAEHGSFRGSKVLLDRLEYQARNGQDGYAWEGEGWYGGDYDRLWVKTEGEGDFGGAVEKAEVQLLWSHALDAWFNLQTGIRYDIRPKSQRTHLAVGVQGLAPYWFEIDAALFLSDRGDLTARIEGEYDQRITNQLILQPRIEVTFSAQDVPDIGLGSGLSSAEAGLRLRYEFVPEFAPYLGVQYERSFGDTTRFARAEGDRASQWALVAGLRMWF